MNVNEIIAKKKIRRVYIAGAYSADNVISVLDNIREGMRAGTELFLKGYSPFVPWFDFHFQLMLQKEESLSIDDYYRYSIDWLEASDILYILKNNKNSSGTQKEIKRANELKIPKFYEKESLPLWENIRNFCRLSSL